MYKHTPGPWYTRTGLRGEDISIGATRASGNPHWVGRAYNAGILGPSDPESEANARLIAAAPELLTALGRLLTLRDKVTLADEHAPGEILYVEKLFRDAETVYRDVGGV